MGRMDYLLKKKGTEYQKKLLLEEKEKNGRGKLVCTIFE